MNIEKRNIKDLQYAEYNPRKKLKAGDDEYEKIRRSIERWGYVDPVIINADNTIIGGHQRCTVLKDLGETEIDVVVVDISKDDEKALNIALNKISGEWDEDALQSLLKDLQSGGYDITLTGFDLSDLLEELSEEIYTKEIKIPQYPVTGRNVLLSECVNTAKTEQLLEQIEASSLDEDKKDFLRKAAQRHNSFHYGNVAEYYANTDPEMQELMEASALVIIDYEDAIHNGYVRLSDDIKTMLEEDTDYE